MSFLPKWPALTLALAIGSGSLFAQPAPDPAKDAPAKDAPAKDAPAKDAKDAKEDDAKILAKARAKSDKDAKAAKEAKEKADKGGDKPVTSLSVGEMQSQLTTIGDKIKTDVRHVMHLREVARKQNDVIKLTCVNEKLLQLKAQQNIVGASQVQLQAVLTDDTGLAQSDRFALFTQVSLGGDAVRKLREEAEACIGEGDLAPSETAVNVSSPDIVDDPTKAGDIFQPGVEPPGYASPYR